MDTEQLSTVQRLNGDGINIVENFDHIAFLIRTNDKEGKNDQEIFYFLRKIVDKCDHISSQIEMNFREI